MKSKRIRWINFERAQLGFSVTVTCLVGEGSYHEIVVNTRTHNIWFALFKALVAWRCSKEEE